MRSRSYRPVALAAVLIAAACSSSPPTAAGPTSTIHGGTSPATPAATTTLVDDRSTVVPAVGAAPHLVDPGSWCMRSASFGDPEDSPYVLPYPPGKRYEVDQAYCNSQGTHKNQMAYDFAIPMGAEIVAARAGTVIDLNERTEDGPYGTANYVVIAHDDGTYALYGHLQHQGVDVEIGDRVESGERIGSSGASAASFGPHLHFAVGHGVVPTAERADVAVTFSNAVGEFDLFGGLMDGSSYLAVESGKPIDRTERVPIGDYSEAVLDGLTLPGSTLWAFGFAGASMRGADLAGAELGWAVLAGADLTGADLSGARLADADLSGAGLREADLAGAALTGAMLREADLRDAVLRNAYLAAADLTGADLRGAVLEGVSLIGCVWDESTRWPDGFTPPPQP